MSQQRGYILFVTFSILALCVGLISAFLVKGMTHKKLAFVLLEQNKLLRFAFSTPSLAQSFLAFSADQMAFGDDKKNVNEQKSSEQEFAKLLLEKVLPVVNKTQKFNLREIDKDLPAQVSLIFFSESGKININGLYDLVNKKFYNEGVPGQDLKVFTTWLFDKIAVLTEKPSLLGPFLEHLKQRTSPFNDVTELLAIKEFAACFDGAIFYDDDNQNQLKEKNKPKIFLTDIFTVACEHDRIQPWLLSPSLCTLLGIAQKKSKVEGLETKEDKKIDISSFKVQVDWAKDWDTLLKPLYGIGFDKIPEETRYMLATDFTVTVFSVLVTVKQEVVDGDNNMTVRVFAILKQKKLPDSSIMYDVIKLYQV